VGDLLDRQPGVDERGGELVVDVEVEVQVDGDAPDLTGLTAVVPLVDGEQQSPAGRKRSAKTGDRWRELTAVKVDERVRRERLRGGERLTQVG
jgi:hypothetical protein